MSSLFKRIKSLVTNDDDTEKKTICRAKGKGKKLHAPCDFGFTFPFTARNSSSISLLTTRTNAFYRNKSSFIEKADYEAVCDYDYVDYVKTLNKKGEINLIKKDEINLNKKDEINLNKKDEINKTIKLNRFQLNLIEKDEIKLIKKDQLLFIHSNYSDFALVKNLRSKKIGFVPFKVIVEKDDNKEKE